MLEGNNYLKVFGEITSYDFTYGQSSGLIPLVCLVPLGCFSRLKKAPLHRPLEPKIRAAKKNSSSFFVFCVPSLHTRTQYIRQG